MTEPTTGFDELRDRVGHLESQFETLSGQLADNTATTRRVESNTADLIELFQSFRGAFKVFEYIGKLAKPLGAIVALLAAIAGLWTALKTGVGR